MSKVINKFLTNTKNIGRSAVIWNALAATMNSFQTMVLLMLVTRFGTMEDSSVFVIAYAIGNLMLNVGKFGIRQFQVTDTEPKYSFNIYLKSRKFSCVLMLIFALCYIGYNLVLEKYTLSKALIVFVICFFKAIEAYEDVYGGLFQQKGRLDVASKILGLRLCVFVFCCGVVFVATKNLLLTVTINTVVSLLISVALNKSALKELKVYDNIQNDNTTKQLTLECLPLCVCMCLNMYVANAPKYAVDTVVSDEAQTCFNIVFMPVFIIALLANFIFQPCLKNLGDVWSKGEIGRFTKRICVLGIAVVAVCLAATLVGALIGTQVLGFVYKVDINDYKLMLIIFMICGGIIALQNLLIMALTVVRYQKYMIYGYITAAALLLVLCKFVLNRSTLTMLTVVFAAVMLWLLIYCALLLLVAVIKAKKGERV